MGTRPRGREKLKTNHVVEELAPSVTICKDVPMGAPLPGRASRPSPILAVVGPTGSGKSALAMELALHLGGEVLSCDSVQVYRGFHIGCAKPSPADRERVPHHLLDLVDAHEPFDAATYARVAGEVIEDVRRRGRVPILCGGTGLYVRALRYGLIDVCPPEPTLRARLEQMSLPELRARLAELDPVGAQEVDLHNRARVQRAVEICEITSQPASAVRARHAFAEERVPMHVVVLSWPRDTLRQRLWARLQHMMNEGFVAEVEGLLAQGVSPQARPMQAVGYREVCEVVTGRAPRAGLEDRIFVSTWRYAKRQLTWWRKEVGVQWLDMSAAGGKDANANQRTMEQVLAGLEGARA